MNPLTQSKNATILPVLIALMLGCFGLLPTARTQTLCRDGCDTGTGATFQGDFPLNSNTTGYGNTAIGALALNQNTSGSSNTAIGLEALASNTTASDNTASGFYGAL